MLTLGVVKDTLEPDTPFLLPQLSRVDIVLLGEIIENEHAMNLGSILSHPWVGRKSNEIELNNWMVI